MVNDHHRWVVDPAADAATGNAYRQVQAVFDGDLYIDEVLNETAPPADKLVRLVLRLHTLERRSLTVTLPAAGVARVPRFAFYSSIEHASLRPAMERLGYTDDDALEQFLSLGLLESKPEQRFALPVYTGQVIGTLGEVALDGGGTGRALDFRLALSRHGRDSLYPDALYAEVARADELLLLHGSGLNLPGEERNPERSVWSVCAPRVVLHCNDEWNQPLGRNRTADLTLRRGDGEELAWSYATGGSPAPHGVVAVGAWAAGHETATLQAHGEGVPVVTTLLLSAVPSGAAAADSLTVELTAPRDVTFQALDPDDWFPAQGGKGWDPATRTHTQVTIPAPHRPAGWTNGNRVTPLIDGHAYFADLAAELDRVTASTHYVCQAGWWFDHTFPLGMTYNPVVDPPVPTGGDQRTLGDHWQRVASAGAPLFMLGWDNVGGPLELLTQGLPPGGVRNLWSSIEDYGDAALSFAAALVTAEALAGVIGGAYTPTAAAVAAVNNLTGPGPHEAILDGRTRPAASHHAKMAAIRNDRGLVAFVGGIDLNANRVNSGAHHDYLPGTQPYHDVQCRVEGPAARDVLRTFLSRWNDHPPMDGLPDDYNGKTGDLFCTPLGSPAAPTSCRCNPATTAPAGPTWSRSPGRSATARASTAVRSTRTATSPRTTKGTSSRRTGTSRSRLRSSARSGGRAATSTSRTSSSGT